MRWLAAWPSPFGLTQSDLEVVNPIKRRYKSEALECGPPELRPWNLNMGVRVENLPREEEIKLNVGSSMDTNDLQVMNEDLDSYSDSSGGDKIFASVIEIQGNIVMNSSEDYKKTIANFQRELAATISGAERSEAIRQAKELELAQVSLSNKKLLQTCQNQQIKISHLEEQLETTNNKNNKMITDLNLRMEAEESHFKDKERALAGQLNDRIEQTQLLKDCLNETQTRLSMMENERDELNLEVDRLNRELAHVTEERMKTELLMESELSDMSKLKVNHEKLVREYENLRERFERTEQRLVSLRGGLPTIVRQAVTNAVRTMQTVATVQLERANNRLTETEERLEEQLERLRQLEFGENGREQPGLHADNPIRSHSAEHVTDTTARKPELKPRSKTKTHDPIYDEEVSGSELLPHLDERPNQPIDELSKSYNQSALIELDQRRLYKKLCDAILILEDGVSGMRKTRKNLPDRPSRPTKSPLSGMRSTSRDKSDSTRPRVRVPAPPWRATSRKPSENRSVIVVHSTKLKDMNVQKDGRISHQTISDDERTSNSLFEEDAKDLQLKIWNAVNQLIGMLRVRREGIEAPKPDLSKRLQKLEKENQALQSMLHNLPSPECKQDPIVSSVCTRYAYTAQPLQAIPSTTCGNIHTRDSNFHRTIAALPCCASGSHLVDLESRCFHAVSEASRWKRRWQTQEEELRAQRERISVMKVSQQADMKIREHFLQSVCKLVREASHQIDRIVRKTQSCGHGYLHQPCCAPFNAMQLNTPAVDTPQPTPRLERISHRSHGRVQETNRSDRSRKVDDPGCGSVLATAHGDEARRGTHRINRSVAVGPISHSTTEEIGDLPDTNCNNNEISGPHSDIKSILCAEDPGIVAPDSPDQPAAAAAASVPLASADNRALCPDLYLTGSPLSKTASIISDVQSASGVSEWQYGTEKDELDDSKLDDDQTKQMPSDGAPTEASLVASSQHVAVENGNTEENLARWNAMREAARYELSRVLANVVAQARQEDSIAQECLEAITDLQTQLEFEDAASQKPQSPENDCPVVDSPPQPLEFWSSPAGEGKEKPQTASRRHLSATRQLVRRHSSCRSRGVESQPVHGRLYNTSNPSKRLSKELTHNSTVDHETMSNASFNRDSRSENQTSLLSNSYPKRLVEKSDDRLFGKQVDKSREKPRWRPAGRYFCPMPSQPLSAPRSRAVNRVSRYFGSTKQPRPNPNLQMDIGPNHVDAGEGLLNSPQVTSNSDSPSRKLDDQTVLVVHAERSRSREQSPICDNVNHNRYDDFRNSVDAVDGGFYSDGNPPPSYPDLPDSVIESSQNERSGKCSQGSMQSEDSLEHFEDRLAEQRAHGDRWVRHCDLYVSRSPIQIPTPAQCTANSPRDSDQAFLSQVIPNSATGSVAVLTGSTDHSNLLVTVNPDTNLSKSFSDTDTVKKDINSTPIYNTNNTESCNHNWEEDNVNDQSCSLVLNVVEPSGETSTANRFCNVSCGSCCCGTACCAIYLDNLD